MLTARHLVQLELAQCDRKLRALLLSGAAGVAVGGEVADQRLVGSGIRGIRHRETRGTGGGALPRGLGSSVCRAAAVCQGGGSAMRSILVGRGNGIDHNDVSTGRTQTCPIESLCPLASFSLGRCRFGRSKAVVVLLRVFWLSLWGQVLFRCCPVLHLGRLQSRVAG